MSYFRRLWDPPFLGLFQRSRSKENFTFARLSLFVNALTSVVVTKQVPINNKKRKVTYPLFKRYVSRGGKRKWPSLVRQKANHRKGGLRRRTDSTLNRLTYASIP